MNIPSSRCLVAIVLAAIGICAWGQAPSAVITIAPKPGMDMGQQIADCVSQLTAQNGGICDARAFSGPQQDTAGATGSALFIGSLGRPVQLMLGSVALFTNQVIKVQANSSIVGMPSVPGTGNLFGSSIIAAAGSNLGAVVEMDGGWNTLQDLQIDGNKNNNPSGGAGVLVNKSNRVEMFRVTVQNAPTHGILIYSGPPATDANGRHTGNESCCGKLQQVMAVSSGRVGLYLSGTADIYVSLSNFDNNGTTGIELNDSPTIRLEHSEIGGNLGNGIRIYGSASGLSSSKEMIVGNQFGNNRLHDILISGPYAGSNLISSNEFIGSDRRLSGYHGIHIENNGMNTIMGNTFFTSSHPFAACVYISGDYVKDQLIGNLCAEHVKYGIFVR